MTKACDIARNRLAALRQASARAWDGRSGLTWEVTWEKLWKQLSEWTRRSSRDWFSILLAAWLLLLAIFYFFPQIDIAVARAFFTETACGAAQEAARRCGGFPYASESAFIAIRRVLFYLPAAVGVWLIVRLAINLGKRGRGYSAALTRSHAIALTSLLVGPYLLVNLILKEISARPRPYETDLFAGRYPFTAAGDFSGACGGNCSFISGEAAGAGWLVSLIVLLPAHLRPVLGPSIVAISLIAPALRLAFGGHYLSDVVLGFLSALVVHAGVSAAFEMSQRRAKISSGTRL